MPEIRRALIVACDEFEGYPPLRAPVTEALELASLLADPEVGGFQVKTVLNESQQRTGIAINSFFREGSANDLLLLYLAGHGALDEELRFYYVTHDSRPDHLEFSAVEGDLIHRAMQRSLTKRRVLIVDCCFSGALTKSVLARGGASVGLNEQLASRGVVLLTASDEVGYAFEKPESGSKAKSIFTSRVIEGMKSGDADRDEDGKISTDDLYDYVRMRIRSEDSRQNPQRSGTTDGLIILAKSRARNDVEMKIPLRGAIEPPYTERMVIGGGTSDVKISSVSASQRSEHAAFTPPEITQISAITATKDQPFVNGLDMRFVPVPITGGPTAGQQVLFSVWETRIQDYAAYAAENPHVNMKWKDVKNEDEKQGPTHPVVNVNWVEAKTFCAWLTGCAAERM